MTARLVFVLLVGSLLFTSCGDDAGDYGGTFTEPDARFVVEPGDDFVVVLESNATTGYSWAPASALDDAVVELVDDTYVDPDSDLVGAPGRQELTFRAVADGSTFIELWYVRPFDEPPDPADRAQFEVVVGSGVPAGADGPSDGDEPQSTIPDDENAISVADLLADAPVGDVIVRESLFDDGSGWPSSTTTPGLAP